MLNCHTSYEEWRVSSCMCRDAQPSTVARQRTRPPLTGSAISESADAGGSVPGRDGAEFLQPAEHARDGELVRRTVPASIGVGRDEATERPGGSLMRRVTLVSGGSKSAKEKLAN